MTDLVPLLDDFRDPQLSEACAEVLRGASVRSVARRYGLDERTLTQAYKRTLPRLDDATLMHLRQEQIGRLQALQSAFCEHAVREHDAQAGMVTIRASEQISMIAGLNAAQPSAVTLTTVTSPTSDVARLSKLRTMLAHLDTDPSHLRRKAEEAAAARDPDASPLP